MKHTTKKWLKLLLIIYLSLGLIILIIQEIGVYILGALITICIFIGMRNLIRYRNKRNNNKKQSYISKQDNKYKKLMKALDKLVSNQEELKKQNKSLNTTINSIQKENLRLRQEQGQHLQNAVVQNKRDLLSSFYTPREDDNYNQADIFQRQQMYAQQEKKTEALERKEFAIEVKTDFLEQDKKINEMLLEQGRQYNETHRMNIDAQNALERARIVYEKQSNAIEFAKKEFKLESERLAHYEEVIESKFTMAKMYIETFSREAGVMLKEMELKDMATNMLRESTQVDINLEYDRIERMEQNIDHLQSTINQELKHGRQVATLQDKLYRANDDLSHSRLRYDSLRDQISMIRKYGS